jgi:hypothetical protein
MPKHEWGEQIRRPVRKIDFSKAKDVIEVGASPKAEKPALETTFDKDGKFISLASKAKPHSMKNKQPPKAKAKSRSQGKVTRLGKRGWVVTINVKGNCQVNIYEGR